MGIERLNFLRNHFLFLKNKKENVCRTIFLFAPFFELPLHLVVIQHQRLMSLKIIEHFAKHHNNQKVSFRFSYWKFILQNYRLNVKFFFFFFIHFFLKRISEKKNSIIVILNHGYKIRTGSAVKKFSSSKRYEYICSMESYSKNFFKVANSVYIIEKIKLHNSIRHYQKYKVELRTFQDSDLLISLKTISFKSKNLCQIF